MFECRIRSLSIFIISVANDRRKTIKIPKSFTIFYQYYDVRCPFWLWKRPNFFLTESCNFFLRRSIRKLLNWVERCIIRCTSTKIRSRCSLKRKEPRGRPNLLIFLPPSRSATGYTNESRNNGYISPLSYLDWRSFTVRIYSFRDVWNCCVRESSG